MTDGGEMLTLLARAARNLQRRLAHLERRERSEVSGAHPRIAFAALPPVGREGAINYCTDCRKIGEAPAAGTGCLVYYSAAGPAGPGWYVVSSDVLAAV